MATIPSDETAPFNPGDVYQESKLAGEKVAHAAIAAGHFGPPPETISGGAWAIETACALGLPVVALFGESDPITLHAPALAGRAEVIVLSDLGHTLARERDGKVGPIDAEAVGRIVEAVKAISDTR
ncbi:MAG: hypothetical protein HC882_04880 [Acidobacteria bacterium]|nr:hypothetical protein [Acidobacteriota bacterium]